MRLLRPKSLLPLAMGTLLMCLGCGGDRVVDVHPKFTLNGAPLTDASVTFVPKDTGGGRAAFGMTDQAGVARMTTYDPNDGVPPGSYSVVVVKAPDDPNTFEEVEVDINNTDAVVRSSAMRNFRETARRTRRVRTLLPELYSDPGTTPLECTVDASTDELAFDIPSK